MNSLPWHLILMAAVYVFAGIMHFLKPKIYLRIMPRYLPNHRFLVYLSGFFEVVLGLTLLVDQLRNIAVIGIIGMLFIFLLVHFYMLKGKNEGAGFPKWLLILRIPIQFFLMAWAFNYYNY